ncbi:hypothetical protein BEP19_08735 [Ammoniphilus oxalaticus]|uniref:Uncharacterized protein n=1 Tax=Ammoniphilus oxalaticus TaxID=66863 RepID=A0A419SKC4_9BACL|nr:hypothetical protein BEP19_08735 [Ammoniphilus oxalaticus]
MRKTTCLSLISGAIVTLFGLLPFIFAYPYSDGPHSGPSNLWELALMVAYEGKGWYLLIGIALFTPIIFTCCKRLFHPRESFPPS